MRKILGVFEVFLGIFKKNDTKGEHNKHYSHAPLFGYILAVSLGLNRQNGRHSTRPSSSIHWSFAETHFARVER